MTNEWYLLRSGPGAPSWNMAVDEMLLESAATLGAPILRLYSWSEPAATFGYSQRYDEVCGWTALRPLIRRATGGGLVPHDADWTYSLIFPPQHPWYELCAEESYRQVHDWVSAAFQHLQIQSELSSSSEKPVLGRCFIGAEKFDVLAGGKKIAGAAQKRNKLGLLVQGSVQPPPRRAGDRDLWEKALIFTGAERFKISWRELILSKDLIQRAAEFDALKYSTTEHNKRR